MMSGLEAVFMFPDNAHALGDLAVSAPVASRSREMARRIACHVGPLRLGRRKGHQDRIAFYAQFITAGDLCFDVGANVGNRIAAFHALGAQVVAVEPQDSCLSELARRYGWSSRIAILPVGLADREGTQTLRIASFDQISSMSAEWLDAVRSTGRFGAESWPSDRQVRVTTLDKLIDAFGLPRFCKIDVEGFELKVLQGLSVAVPALSFEFTPECIGIARGCIERLSQLAEYEYNYSIGESMRFALPAWVGPDGIGRMLSAFPGVPPLFGDVYGRRRGTGGGRDSAA
jgi:FkbM family methyltransferase